MGLQTSIILTAVKNIQTFFDTGVLGGVEAATNLNLDSSNIYKIKAELTFFALLR